MMTPVYGGNAFDWSWIIGLLVVGGLFGGYGGFGANNGVTQDYIANQFIQRDLYNNNTNILEAKYDNAIQTLENRVNCNNNARMVSNEVIENRFQNQVGQCNLQKDILLGNQTLGSTFERCCCELKEIMHKEGEATRALIQAGTIQDLRDKVADKDREALATGLSYANTITARNLKDDIFGTMGKWFMNPPYYNPYYANGYGYGYGTTIQ